MAMDIGESKWMWKQMEAWAKANPMPTRMMCDTAEDFDAAFDIWLQLERQQRARLYQVEMKDAKFTAYKKAVQDATASVIRDRVQKGDFAGMTELEQLMGQLKNKGGNGGNLKSTYFVTVNCKPDVTITELKKKVDKYVKRSMIRQAEWVFEQRGAHEGELGKGIHTHILVTQRGDVFDGKFKENTRNTFKSLVGNPQTHVDIRPVHKDHIADKRAYMKGAKTGDGKMEKVEMDRVWRAKYFLKEYYTHENTNGNEEEANSSHSAPSRQASSNPDATFD